ncbi:MAG: glycosyltransferase, partial [bacterium]
MKIVIVAAAYPFRGGIAHHTALLYRELSKRHTIEIVTFTRQYPKFLFPGTTQQEEGGELLSVPTTRLIDSINPFTWVKTGFRIRARQPDLVIFAYSMPFFAPAFGTIAAIARRAGRTKVLFLCHNIIPHEPIPGDTLLTRYAFSFADYFIVQSDQVARDLLKLVPAARYKVSPHPIYEMFGDPHPKSESRKRLGLPDSNIILFFGYVRRYKGLGVLIEAMKLIRNNLPDALLLVVGEFYEDEELFRKQVTALGLEDAVKFVSHY